MKRATKPWTVIILVILLLLTACQPTPEAEPVINRGDGKMKAAIARTPEPAATDKPEVNEPYEAPAHWQESFTVNGTPIEIDAEVIPPKGAVPVYSMGKTELESEQILAVIAQFTEATRWHVASPTREQLLYWLEQAVLGEYAYDDPETGEPVYLPYEGQQEQIDSLQEQLRHLEEPEWQALEADKPGTGQRIYGDDEDDTVYTSARDDYLLVKRDSRYFSQGESLVLQGEALPGERHGTMVGEVSMTQERAEALGLELLGKLGLTDFEILKSEKARRVQENQIIGTGYRLYCTWKTPGMPAPSQSVYGGSNMLANPEDAAYAAETEGELITVYFEDEKLYEFTWSNPYRKTRLENANVELAPFPFIQEQMRKHFRYGLSWTSGERLNEEVLVERVALTYYPVAKVDAIDEYYWAPVWAVIYSMDVAKENYIFPDIMMINAIDGSVMIPAWYAQYAMMTSLQANPCHSRSPVKKQSFLMV